MLDKETIVTTMIKQHRDLQKEVRSLAEVSEKEEVDFEQINKGLKQFEKDLAKHLKLEDEVFYPELLKDMKQNGIDTANTEQFILEMKEIEQAILAFLDKYGSSDKIKNKIDEFKKELPKISSTLNLRIESEEAGVYGYWGLI